MTTDPGYRVGGFAEVAGSGNYFEKWVFLLTPVPSKTLRAFRDVSVIQEGIEE
jgi:hypothetical protein